MACAFFTFLQHHPCDLRNEFAKLAKSLREVLILYKHGHKHRLSIAQGLFFKKKCEDKLSTRGLGLSCVLCFVPF